MTQHPPTTTDTCPQCRGTSGVPLSTGDRLCLTCHNEWNPRAVTNDESSQSWIEAEQRAKGPHLTPVVIITTHAETGARAVERNTYITSEPHTVDDALRFGETYGRAGVDGNPNDQFLVEVVLADDYDDDARGEGVDVQADTSDIATIEAAPPDNVVVLDEWAQIIAEARVKYVGRRVSIGPDDAVGTITAISDDGTSVIELDGGGFAELLPDEYDLLDTPKTTDEPTDDVVEAIGTTTLTVAALVLRAGVSAIEAGEGDGMIGVPPSGWLPADADIWPIVEAGAAYAVAMLIHAYDLDVDQVTAIAEDITNDAPASAPNQEG